MLKKKMEEALNKQINAELYSSYLYLSMAAHFEASNYPGFAHWMKLQSFEEYEHAMKIYEYVVKVGGEVKLDAIEKPPANWGEPKSVFEETLKHEQHVTSLINNLVDISLSEKDHATNSFLQWFVDEQVEEEDTVNNILDKFELLGDNKAHLFMLDNELGARTNTGEE